MRLPASFLISLVLHGAAAGLLLMPSPVQPKAKTPPIEFTVYTKPAKKPGSKSGQQTAKTPQKATPRLGSEDYRLAPRPLGTTLAALNYLDRLKQHIEPHWHNFVQASRLQASCTTVLDIDADVNGTVLIINTVSNDCPEKLENAAKQAFWCANIIPPPKIFLDAKGILLLQWTFTLRRKED